MSNDFEELRSHMLQSGIMLPNGRHAPRTDATKYQSIRLEIENAQLTELSDFHTLNERMWALFNRKYNRPTCSCGKKLEFRHNHKNYARFCSSACLNHDSDVIKKRNISYSKVDKDVIRKKIKLTCLKKYGTDYACQSKAIRQKIENTCLQKYGIRTPFNKGKIRDKIERLNLKRYGVKNQFMYGSSQFKNLMVDRYGSDNYNKTTDGRCKVSLIHSLSYNKDKFFKRMEHILKQENVIPLFNIDDYSGIINDMKWKHLSCGNTFIDTLDNGNIPSCPICWGSRSHLEAIVKKWFVGCTENVQFSNRSIIKPYELDIVFPNKKLAVEINGSYWHNADSNTIPLLEKYNMAHKAGYRLIHLWDYEIKNKPHQVKSILMASIGKFDNIIYARECTVKKINWSAVKDFINRNHIQGAGKPTSLNYGLFYNDKMVSLMTFGKRRFDNNDGCELYRYCNELNTCVIGGASKLFKHAPKQPIISYCDRRLFSGNVYIKLGFTEKSLSKPGYVWYNKHNVLNRLKTQKHKLKKMPNYDPELTEDKIMKSNGYMKLIDCGQIVYTRGFS